MQISCGLPRSNSYTPGRPKTKKKKRVPRFTGADGVTFQVTAAIRTLIALEINKWMCELRDQVRSLLVPFRMVFNSSKWSLRWWRHSAPFLVFLFKLIFTCCTQFSSLRLTNSCNVGTSFVWLLTEMQMSGSRWIKLVNSMQTVPFDQVHGAKLSQSCEGCGYNCSLVIFGFFEWWCFIKMKRKFVLSGLWLGNFLRLGPFRGQCVCGKCVELSESSRFFTFPPVSVTGSVNIQHPLVFEMTKIKIAISHWWVTWQPKRQSRKGRSRGGLFHQSIAADVEVLF